MRWTVRAWVIVLVSALLIAGAAWESSGRPTPADARPYHDAVRDAVRDMPRQIGEWVGVDSEAPPEAVRLLRPNVLVSRDYRHPSSGDRATLLLVQCKDVRDMLGHYPPVCYPASGWTPVSQKPQTWQVGGLELPGVRYVFEFTEPGRTSRLYVDNFLLMPTGQAVRDMDEVAAAEEDYTRRFHGAAQVQVVTYEGMSDERRTEIFHKLIGANTDLLKLLLSGSTRDRTDQE